MNNPWNLHLSLWKVVDLTVNHVNVLELKANHLKSAELTASRLNVEQWSKGEGNPCLEHFSWARGHRSAPQRRLHRPPLERETDRTQSGWDLDWRLDWSQNKNVEKMTQISNPPPISRFCFFHSLFLSLPSLFFSLLFNMLTSCGTFFPPYTVSQANHFTVSLPDYRRSECTFMFLCLLPLRGKNNNEQWIT